jgi:hypothetical protein
MPLTRMLPSPKFKPYNHNVSDQVLIKSITDVAPSAPPSHLQHVLYCLVATADHVTVTVI